MATSYNIFTAFRAKDKVTPAFKKMGKGATAFGDKSSKAFRGASRSGKGFVGFAKAKLHTVLSSIGRRFVKMGKKAINFGDKTSWAFKKAARSGNKFNKVLKGILVGGLFVSTFLLLKRGLGAVSTEFISFDQAITSASAKFKDLNLSTEAGQKTLASLKKTARDVGAVTQFTAGQAAQGLDFLAMAGFSAQQSMSLLPGVVDLATVANVDLGRATDIASDALGAFGLMTEDSAQLTKNFNRVNDAMAFTMARTNTGIEDMFEAIRNGAPAFIASGQSVESFTALLGVLANAGIKGSKSGTDLTRMMLSLAKPTGEAADLISSLGVKIRKSGGGFRDIMDILGDFEKGLKGMGDAQKMAALKTIFGQRTVTSFSVLMKEGTKAVRGFRKETIAAGGKSKEMADIMRKSIGNQLKAMGSAAIEVGFKFFTAFEKQGAGAIKTATDAIRNFDVQPIINGINFTINVFKKLFDFIKPAFPFIKEQINSAIDAIGNFDIQPIINGFGEIFETIRPLFPLIIDGMEFAFQVFKTIIPIVFETIKTVFPFIIKGMKLVVGAIKGLFGFIDKLFDKFEILKSFKKGFKNFFGIGDVTKTVGNIKLKAPDAFPLRDIFSRMDAPAPQVTLSKKAEAPEAPQAQVIAPNKAEVAARQKIDFQGLLKIAGAPSGSTVEGKTIGAPPIGLELLGVNP